MADDKKALQDQLDQADQAGGSGKGVFCQVQIDMAIKSFAKGLTPEQSFETYVPSDKASEKAAIDKVTAVLTAAGIDSTASTNRPTKVVAYRCFAATVVGSTWKGDLNKLIPTWTRGWLTPAAEKGQKATPGPAKQALSALIESGKFVGFGKKYWAHVKIIQDPGGRKDAQDQTTTIWFVDEIFKDEAAMKEAAHASGETGDAAEPVGHVPEGWPADVWATTLPDILKACEEGGWKAPALAKIAKDYDLTVDFIKSLKAS